MTALQRGHIEEVIQKMQPADLQEFMLKFLPIHNPIYDGMIRHGHSRDAKTRKGTPDLLKTFSDGRQIACQCGTNEGYWVPTEDLSKWKPVEDAQKCIDNLDRPVEIVLASSREISTKYPNAKTTVVDYFASLKITFTFFTSADLASWIEANLIKKEVLKLAQEFFPKAIVIEQLESDVNTLHSAIDIAERLGFPTKAILSIVEKEGLDDGPQLDERVATLFADTSRFTLTLPPEFNGIARYAAHARALSDPFGKVIQILGVPRIGKSTLCWESVCINKFDYVWLLAPDEEWAADFGKAFTKQIYSHFVPSLDAAAMADGRKIVQLPSNATTKNLVIVVDNAHLLPLPQLRRIDRVIQEIKGKGLLGSLSIIFLANRTLAESLSTLDETLVAPPWSASEIQELVKRAGIEINLKDDKYFALLAGQAGGHPLFALALAKKYSTSARLVSNSIQGPLSSDADLSNEIKNVLYQDILRTSDQQNFVQRLALLLGQSSPSVMDALRIKVTPQIQTSAPLLFDQIGPAVLEGLPNSGLAVNVTFRNIAKQRTSAGEKTQVYKAAAKELLTIRNKTIQADPFIDGIIYLIFANEVGRAAAHTMLIMMGLTKSEDREAASTKFVLDRLMLFRFLKDEELSDRDYLTLSSVRLMLGHLHSSLHEFEISSEYFLKIDLARIEKLKIEEIGETDIKRNLLMGVTASSFLAISGFNDPNKVVLRYLDYHKSEDHIIPGEMDMFSEVILHLPPEKLGLLEFGSIAQRLFPDRLDKIARISISLGYKASKNPLIETTIQRIQEEQGPGAAIFKRLAQSSLYSHSNEPKKALALTDEVENILNHVGVSTDLLGPTYFQHFGDLVYQAGEYPRAISLFQKSLALEKRDDDFIVGWANYKIGLVAEDAEVAKHLTIASERFIKRGDYGIASRALGALGAYYLEKNQIAEAVATASKLVGWYHQEKRTGTGPAVRLLLAYALRVAHELKGEPPPEPRSDFPKPERKYFLTMLDDVKPQGGGTISFNIVATLAEAANLKDAYCELLKKAIYAEAESDLDRQIRAICWLRLFESVSKEQFDEGEFTIMLKRLCASQPAPGTKNEGFFFHALFRPFENKAKANPKDWAPVLMTVSRIASDVSNELAPTLAVRWNLYLDFAEGLACQLLGDDKRAFSLLKRSFEKAVAERNWPVAEDSAFILSFSLAHAHPRLNELARTNFELFQCRERIGLTIDNVQNLGVNLFILWSRIDSKRQSTEDLRVSKFLLRPARKMLELGFTREEAAPVMVRLLLCLFSHTKLPDELVRISKELPSEILDLFSE